MVQQETEMVTTLCLWHPDVTPIQVKMFGQKDLKKHFQATLSHVLLDFSGKHVSVEIVHLKDLKGAT